MPVYDNYGDDYYVYINPNEVTTTYQEGECFVTMLSFKNWEQAPSYQHVCNNGSFIYYPAAWYNYTYTYWDYDCGNDTDYTTKNYTATNSTTNSTMRQSVYYDDWSSYYGYYNTRGCYKNESYFFNDTVFFYEYMKNMSYQVVYQDGEREVYQYFDMNGDGYKEYLMSWVNETCTFYSDMSDWTSFAKC
jgi:hypothetical protein